MKLDSKHTQEMKLNLLDLLKQVLKLNPKHAAALTTNEEHNRFGGATVGS